MAIVTTSKKETPIAWVQSVQQCSKYGRSASLNSRWASASSYGIFQCSMFWGAWLRPDIFFPRLNETNQKTGKTSTKHKVNRRLLTNKSAIKKPIKRHLVCNDEMQANSIRLDWVYTCLQLELQFPFFNIHLMFWLVIWQHRISGRVLLILNLT